MSGGTGRVLEGAAAVLPRPWEDFLCLDGAGFRLSAWGAVWAERPFWPSLFWRG